MPPHDEPVRVQWVTDAAGCARSELVFACGCELHVLCQATMVPTPEQRDAAVDEATLRTALAILQHVIEHDDPDTTVRALQWLVERKEMLLQGWDAAIPAATT